MRVYQVHFYYKNGDVFIKRVPAKSRHEALKIVDALIDARADGIIFGYDNWMIEDYDEDERSCL